MSDAFQFDVSETEPGLRLDTWLHQQMPQVSRTQWARLIDGEHVTVGGRKAKARYFPKHGDCIQVVLPPPVASELEPEAIPLDVLLEDDHLLIVNKAPGMCVHPSAGHATGTLVHALLSHCQGQLSGIGGVSRPGIVHRLDQDTSGCIVVAKDDSTHSGLADQFAQRRPEKTYLAITCGSIHPPRGEIRANIARHPSHRKRMAVTDGTGRYAHTSYQRLENYGRASLVQAVLHTGRTHQIRVHFQHIGFPIFGDEVYGKRQTKRLGSDLRFLPPRQMLHAHRIQFQHPIDQSTVRIEAPPPDDFTKTIRRLAAGSEPGPG